MSRRNVLERINIPGPVNSTPEALEAWARSMTSLLTDTFQQFGYAINNLDILLEDGDLIDDRVATLIQDGTGLSWTYDDPNDMLTGNVSLAPFNTGNLSEGSNLYYTDERVDDRVSSLIQDGTGLSWTYDDGANTLAGDVSLSSFDTDDLSEGASNLYYTDARVDARLDTNQTITGSWTINQPWDFNAVVDIRINGGNTHFGHNGQSNYLTSIVSSTLDGATWIREYDADAASYTNIARFETGTIAFFNPVNIEGQTAWHAGNDGPTSGLDADTVDGYEGSELAVLAENNTFTGSTNLDGSGQIYSFNDSGLDGEKWVTFLQQVDASNGGSAVSSYLQGEIGANQYLIHNRISGVTATNDLNDWAWTAFGNNIFLISQQGLLVGEPTGGKKGLGTANFQQSYNNGNATLDTSDLATNGGTVPGVNRVNTFTQRQKIEAPSGDFNGLALGNALTTSNWDISSDSGGRLRVALRGTGTAFLVETDRGIVVSSPTGGSQGAGTINAEGVYNDGNSVLDESDRIENGGNLPKIASGSLTTISLGIGSSVEETVNHGLGTDNVFAIVRLLGSDGSDGHEVNGVSITPDGLRSHFYAGGAPSTIGLGLGSTPSSGNINLLIRNGSGTTSQTVTVDYTIIAA